jgi:hypothetical protein
LAQRATRGWPELGASGAIAAVLGAYFVLYPGSRVPTYIFPVFLIRIPAWIFLGLWFLYQLFEANFGLFSASANEGGEAFFAHVGGFIFGLVVARILTGAGRVVPHTQADSSAGSARSLPARRVRPRRARRPGGGARCSRSARVPGPGRRRGPGPASRLWCH